MHGLIMLKIPKKLFNYYIISYHQDINWSSIKKSFCKFQLFDHKYF